MRRPPASARGAPAGAGFAVSRAEQADPMGAPLTGFTRPAPPDEPDDDLDEAERDLEEELEPLREPPDPERGDEDRPPGPGPAFPAEDAL